MTLLPHIGVPGGLPVPFGLIHLVPGLLHGRPVWSPPHPAVHCPGESDSCTGLSGAGGELSFLFYFFLKNVHFAVNLTVWSIHCLSLSDESHWPSSPGEGETKMRRPCLSLLYSGCLRLGPVGQSIGQCHSPQGPITLH